MTRYRHYKCLVEPGMVGFFTTSCLDSNFALRRDSMRDLICRILCEDALFYKSPLHAYAVMSNHVHFIATIPMEMNGSTFMQRFKEHSAKALMPLLTDDERAGLPQQDGRNGRSFWQRSFDSCPLTTPHALVQKRSYIHENPVTAGLCEVAVDYKWSSAFLYEEGLYDPDNGLAEAAWRCY